MKNGYAGKISHAGSQKIEAPFKGGEKQGKTTVKKGGDLRSK